MNATEIIEKDNIAKMLRNKGPIFVADYVEKNYPNEKSEILIELIISRVDKLKPKIEDEIESITRLANALNGLNKITEQTSVFPFIGKRSMSILEEPGLELYNACAKYVRNYNIAELEED